MKAPNKATLVQLQIQRWYQAYRDGEIGYIELRFRIREYVQPVYNLYGDYTPTDLAMLKLQDHEEYELAQYVINTQRFDIDSFKHTSFRGDSQTKVY